MERIDIRGMKSLEVNQFLRKKAVNGNEITLENPDSIHNLAAAVIGNGKIVVEGATGFYTGDFLDGPSMTVKGNSGWYTGANMMAGEIIIEMNTGSNAAPSMIGGNLVIRGSSGSRCGFGMKGGNLIVCGDVGNWSGGMTLGGRMIFLGKAGKALGESMYNGIIHTADPEAKEKMGDNVYIEPISDSEKSEVKSLFKQYGIDRGVDDLMSIMPLTTGRHTYKLFKPTHKKSA
jgi:glutamate synthase domain-containing protein 3